MDYKFYTDDGKRYLELHDKRTENELRYRCTPEEYACVVDKYVSKMESEFKDLKLLFLGRSGRHVCVEDTPLNRERYTKLVQEALGYEAAVRSYFSQINLFHLFSIESRTYTLDELETIDMIYLLSEPEELDLEDKIRITEAIWYQWSNSDLLGQDETEDRYKAYPWLEELEEEVDDFEAYRNRTLCKFIEEYSKSPVSDYKKDTYRMLSRLKQDCDYWLGAGKRCNKHLWGGTPEKHIKEMYEIWDKIPSCAKPEWLTKEQLLEYEKKLTEASSRIDLYHQLFPKRDAYSIEYNYKEMKVMALLGSAPEAVNLNYEDMAKIAKAIYTHWNNKIKDEDKEPEWLRFLYPDESPYIQEYAKRVIPEFIKLFKEGKEYENN